MILTCDICNTNVYEDETMITRHNNIVICKECYENIDKVCFNCGCTSLVNGVCAECGSSVIGTCPNCSGHIINNEDEGIEYCSACGNI